MFIHMKRAHLNILSVFINFEIHYCYLLDLELTFTTTWANLADNKLMIQNVFIEADERKK